MKINEAIEMLERNLNFAKNLSTWQRDDKEIEMMETIISKFKEKESVKETVNHPQHYNITGRKECIEEMIDIYGIDAVITFCRLNSYKYRYRHELKNGVEDLQKAEWYDAKALSLAEIKNNQSNE